MSSGYTFILASWLRDADEIRQLREQVLVTEMGVSSDLLGQADVPDALHVLVYDAGGRTVGAARMQTNGQVDYVVVLRPWRGCTVGTAIMNYLHHIARARRLERMWCVAPESARNFFEKNLFRQVIDAAEMDTGVNRKYIRMVQSHGSPGSPVQH